MRYFRTVPLCIPCDECYNSRAVLFNPLSVLYVCLWLCVWPVRHDLATMVNANLDTESHE